MKTEMINNFFNLASEAIYNNYIIIIGLSIYVITCIVIMFDTTIYLHLKYKNIAFYTPIFI